MATKPQKQPLTPTEQAVFDALKQGGTAAEIAEKRGVSEQSVYNHIAKIRKKNHQIPQRPAAPGEQSSPDDSAKADVPDPRGAVTANGRGEDSDDVALLVELASPVAQDALALLDGLKARGEELTAEIAEQEQLVRDTEAKIKELHERRDRVEERVREASDVAEAIRPLVAA